MDFSGLGQPPLQAGAKFTAADSDVLSRLRLAGASHATGSHGQCRGQSGTCLVFCSDNVRTYGTGVFPEHDSDFQVRDSEGGRPLAGSVWHAGARPGALKPPRRGTH